MNRYMALVTKLSDNWTNDSFDERFYTATSAGEVIRLIKADFPNDSVCWLRTVVRELGPITPEKQT